MAENVNSIVSNLSVNRQARPVAFRNLYGAFDNVNREVLPISEVIERAECNYEVEKQPLVRVTPEMLDAIRNGEPITGLTSANIINTHCATMRTDNNHTFGVVGSDYGVVQNIMAFEFIDHLQQHFGQQSIIETAGALNEGSRVYVTCRLDEDFYLDDFKKDAVQNYIIITTSHDGSGAIKVFSSPVRVVCQNTLNMALMKKTESISYKHTKNVRERMDYEKIVARFLEQSKMLKNNFVNKMRELREDDNLSKNAVQDFASMIYLSDENYKRYIESNRKLDSIDEVSTRAKNQIERLIGSIESGVGQDMYRGSKLWLLNGLTTLLHNDTAYKSDEEEFKSILEGDGFKKLNKAYAALELVA